MIVKSGRKYVLRAAAFVAVSVLVASVQSCVSTSRSMPMPTRLVELGIVDSDADLESLKRGRTLAMMDCRKCHRQYWPQEFKSKRWPRLSRNMGRLAAMRQDEIDDLMEYMVAASKTIEVETADMQSRADHSD